MIAQKSSTHPGPCFSPAVLARCPSPGQKRHQGIRPPRRIRSNTYRLCFGSPLSAGPSGPNIDASPCHVVPEDLGGYVQPGTASRVGTGPGSGTRGWQAKAPNENGGWTWGTSVGVLGRRSGCRFRLLRLGARLSCFKSEIVLDPDEGVQYG